MGFECGEVIYVLSGVVFICFGDMVLFRWLFWFVYILVWVVYVIDEFDCRGFVYGILFGYFECGEEVFVVECCGDDLVWLVICVFLRLLNVFFWVVYFVFCIM